MSITQMINVATLSKAQILAVLEPERLFGTPEAMPDTYKELARRWHPDVPGGDEETFKHIVVLHDRAKSLIETDAWRIPGELRFESNGKKYALRYFKSFEFALGHAYLSEQRVTYVVRDAYADLVSNAKRIIRDLRSPDKKTEDVMARYMPTLKDTFKTADSTVVMFDKPNDLIRMRDLLDHFGGKIDPKHVAWMVSRMLNHTSYLEALGICHNDLSPDTLFICPEMHTVCVLGGWWYAAKVGEKLKAMPQRSVSNAPTDVIKTKLASVSTDAELVRLTGRELLGNANGIHLANKDIPTPMLNWLRVSGKGSPMRDYKEWYDRILTDSFGPKKFVKLAVTAAEIYRPL